MVKNGFSIFRVVSIFFVVVLIGVRMMFVIFNASFKRSVRFFEEYDPYLQIEGKGHFCRKKESEHYFSDLFTVL